VKEDTISRVEPIVKYCRTVVLVELRGADCENAYIYTYVQYSTVSTVYR
jgi:hypothetical protein